MEHKHSLVDDQRLAIQTIAFCPTSETLLVGGSGGQVIVFKADNTASDHRIQHHVVDIVAATEGFVWNGPEALHMKEDVAASSASLRPAHIVQMHPATKCTKIAFHSTGQL